MMIDREKLMAGLEFCDTVGYCNECQYSEYIKEIRPRCDIHKDAAAEIREDADEIEQLRDQVYNLTLYLQYVEKTVPTIVDSMRAQFSGMPGYAGVENGHHRD